MEPIEVVKLAPEDWALYREIRLESLRVEPAAFATGYTSAVEKPEAYWRGRLEEAQAGEKSWLLFARQAGRLVGMIGAYRLEEPGVVEIISVYVSPRARGQGAGAALMAAILAEVSQGESFHRAVLTVNQKQAAAVALYRRFGFRVTGELSGEMGDGSVQAGYQMERDLERPAAGSTSGQTAS